MNTTKTVISIFIFIAIIGFAAINFVNYSYEKQKDLIELAKAPKFEGIRDSGCAVSDVTAKAIGASNSSTILSASQKRAWAKIQRVETDGGVGTSTPFLSFDEGAAATLNNGLPLATSSPYIEFGRNEELPYVGAVTGITNTGSTTVYVTECLY